MFGDRLKEFRVSLGLTQERMASLLGMKRQSYANVENGSKGMSQELLASVANLGADMTLLLTGKPFGTTGAVEDDNLSLEIDAGLLREALSIKESRDEWEALTDEAWLGVLMKKGLSEMARIEALLAEATAGQQGARTFGVDFAADLKARAERLRQIPHTHGADKK